MRRAMMGKEKVGLTAGRAIFDPAKAARGHFGLK